MWNRGQRLLFCILTTLVTVCAQEGQRVTGGIAILHREPQPADGAAPDLVLRMGHTVPVVRTVFSPDGRCLASGSEDRTVRFWNTATGLEERVLAGHTDTVWALAFSRDGRLLASGSTDGTIRLWDVATGRARKTLRTGDTVMGLSFNAAGDLLVSGETVAEERGRVEVWEIATGRRLYQFLSESPVSSVTFSADGRFVAAASEQSGDMSAWSELRVWELASGRRVREKKFDTPSFGHAMEFSPDGQRLAMISSAGVDIWGLTTGRKLRTIASGQTWDIAFSTDGLFLTTDNNRDSASTWDVRTGGKIHSLSLPRVRSVSRRARLLETNMTLFDAATGADVHKLSTPEASSVLITPGDNTVISCGQEVALWDLKTGKILRKLSGHQPDPSKAAVSPDGKLLVTAGYRGVLKVWDLASGQVLHTLAAKGMVLAVAFRPGTKEFAWSGAGGAIQIWDASSGNELRSVAGDARDVTALAFSADGSYLAAGGQYGDIVIWDAVTWRRQAALSEPHYVRALAFSPDRRLLASGNMAPRRVRPIGADGERAVLERVPGTEANVKIWEVATGRAVRTFGSADAVLALVFSPGGRYVRSVLASGGVRFIGAVKVWDVDTGRDVRTLRDRMTVKEAAFSPDGNWLASIGTGPGISVWKLPAW